jgi:hypothetical protein
MNPINQKTNNENEEKSWKQNLTERVRERQNELRQQQLDQNKNNDKEEKSWKQYFAERIEKRKQREARQKQYVEKLHQNSQPLDDGVARAVEFASQLTTLLPRRMANELFEKKQERLSNYSESKKRETKTDYCPKTNEELSSRIVNRQRRQHNREGYNKRIELTGPRAINNAKRQVDLSGEQRMTLFNKTRKCPCHRERFNTLTLQSNNQWLFGCDRDVQPEAEMKSLNQKCTNCNQGTFYKYIKKDCVCSISHCNWCLLEQYTFNNDTHIYCHCGEYQRIQRNMQAAQIHNDLIQPKKKTWKQENQNHISRKTFFNDLKGKQKKTWKSLPPLKPISIERFEAHGAMASVPNSTKFRLSGIRTN